MSKSLAKRAEIVSYFADRAPDPTYAAKFDLLPSFACHAVLFDTPLPPLGAADGVFHVGHSEPSGAFYGSIYLSPGGFVPEVQQRLPLEGHEPLDAHGVFSWVVQALDEMREIDPEGWEYIQQWCSVIVWVRRTSTDVTELTSTAIPIVPFATFISKKLIRHIPPKHIIPEVTLYGVQENLLHEALHQQMTAHLIVRDALLTSPKQAPKVHIPWRNTDWPIDRVLHAAWVYRGVLRFRELRLARPRRDDRPRFRASLDDCVREGRAAFAYLVQALDEHAHLFRDDAAGAVAEIMGKCDGQDGTGSF